MLDLPHTGQRRGGGGGSSTHELIHRLSQESEASVKNLQPFHSRIDVRSNADLPATCDSKQPRLPCRYLRGNRQKRLGVQIVEEERPERTI